MQPFLNPASHRGQDALVESGDKVLWIEAIDTDDDSGLSGYGVGFAVKGNGWLALVVHVEYSLKKRYRKVVSVESVWKVSCCSGASRALLSIVPGDARQEVRDSEPDFLPMTSHAVGLFPKGSLTSSDYSKFFLDGLMSVRRDEWMFWS